MNFELDEGMEILARQYKSEVGPWGKYLGVLKVAK